MMIKGIDAIAFDFDGLIMDSEPIWHDAERGVLSEHDVFVPPEMTGATTGLRCDEAMLFWKQWFDRSDLDPQKLQAEVENRVMDGFVKKGKAKAGAIEILNHCFDNKIPYSIVSSSPEKVIRCGLEVIGLTGLDIRIFSTEHLQFGKPHPEVYTWFCREHGIAPERGLVFEDSFNGGIAAKAAKMKLVLIPEEENAADNPRFGFADKILSSLEEAEIEMWMRR